MLTVLAFLIKTNRNKLACELVASSTLWFKQRKQTDLKFLIYCWNIFPSVWQEHGLKIHNANKFYDPEVYGNSSGGVSHVQLRGRSSLCTRDTPLLHEHSLWQLHHSKYSWYVNKTKKKKNGRERQFTYLSGRISGCTSTLTWAVLSGLGEFTLQGFFFFFFFLAFLPPTTEFHSGISW